MFLLPPPYGEGRGGGRSVANHLARSLRNNATPAERILWQQVRLLKGEGRHFRRQMPIGRYIADFACHSCKLVVEIDGGQHNSEAGQIADQRRTQLLEREGYRVIRFWNVDVLNNIEGVVDMIRNSAHLPTLYDYQNGEAGATPTPTPPHKGEGL